ncbi:MAG: hypothetical protein OHK0013_20940 [Sandaracinaceae bacterium]
MSGARSFCLLSTALVMIGCDGPASPPMRDAGPAPPNPAVVQNIAAYEGQEAFVTVLESGGDDWSTATIRSEHESLEIRAQACGPSLCGAVLRIRDTLPNTGQTIPAPLDAPARFLRVDAPDGPRQGLVRVMPLDSLTAPSGQTRVSGVYFASSVAVSPGSILRGIGDRPVRWVVFGSAVIDTFDVSAAGALPGPGGGEGGAPGAAGRGPGGGPGATAKAGAGGGASASAGGRGELATEGAEPIDIACITDLFATACGGGGGGGGRGTSGGAGGGGGGSLSLIVLGSLELGMVRALGGDGAVSGGAGGGGGLVHVAATSLTGSATVEVTGGAGEGTGGRGGEGAARMDGHFVSGTIRGPRVDVATDRLLTRSASLVVTGDAAPGRVIRVVRVNDTSEVEVGSGTSGVDGFFSVEVTLEPGLSRLAVIQVESDGSTLRAFNGNHVELERRDPSSPPLPVGGLLDVAYIP